MRLVAPATAAVNSSPERWGESTTRTPTNPMTTADQRYTRTRSFKMSAASVTVNRGELNAIALDSTRGSRATAPKLKNMPAMLSTPLPACPSGRSVRTTAASSPRQHERNDREHRAVKHDLADR